MGIFGISPDITSKTLGVDSMDWLKGKQNHREPPEFMGKSMVSGRCVPFKTGFSSFMGYIPYRNP